MKIQQTFLARPHGQNLNFPPNNNLESLRTKISPRLLLCTCSVMFYEQLEIDNFCPQSNILPEQQEIRSANDRRMKYVIFEVKFLQEKIIVERWEMAHSTRLEKSFYMKQ